MRKAFAEERLLKAVASEQATFYLAFENKEILGFVQTIQQDFKTAELDRTVVFPEHTERRIGAQLLKHVIKDQKKRGTDLVIVNAGKEETHARRFYEKNDFELIKETTIQAPWRRKLDIAIYYLRLASS
jgi:ribosomal protein S18 acetylase RimI-like enzyme